MTETASSGSARERPASSLEFGALAAIFALATFLATWRIDRQSLWLDEFLTLELAAGHGFVHERLPERIPLGSLPDLTATPPDATLASVWRGVEDTSHPPLYFVVLAAWRKVFGDGDVAARTLSAAFSVAGVALVVALGRSLFGREAALWAGLLMAIAPRGVVLAQEARNYTIAVAAVLGLALVVRRLESSGASVSRAALAGLLVFAALLSHYFAAGPVAAIGLYAVVRLRGPARRASLWAFGLGGAAFAALWGPSLLVQRQLASEFDAWARDPAASPLLSWCGRLMSSPASALASFLDPPAVLASLLTLAWLGVVGWKRRRETLLPALILAGSLGLVASVDLLRGTRLLIWPRYSILAVPAVLLLVPAAAQGGWKGRLAPALAVLYALHGLPGSLRPYKPDWRLLSSVLEQGTAPGDLVIFVGDDSRRWLAGSLRLQAARYAPLEQRRTLLLPNLKGRGLAAVLAGRGFAIVSLAPLNLQGLPIAAARIRHAAYVPDGAAIVTFAGTAGP